MTTDRTWKQMTPYARLLLLSLYASGEKVEVICALLGVTRHTITYHTKNAGMPVRQRGRRAHREATRNG